LEKRLHFLQQLLSAKIGRVLWKHGIFQAQPNVLMKVFCEKTGFLFHFAGRHDVKMNKILYPAIEPPERVFSRFSEYPYRLGQSLEILVAQGQFRGHRLPETRFARS
jgi:hypothetical protein